MFDSEYFAKMLSTTRLYSGLSLREMGSLIGVSAATLQRVESGKKPDIDTFMKICKWANWNSIEEFEKVK